MPKTGRAPASLPVLTAAPAPARFFPHRGRFAGAARASGARVRAAIFQQKAEKTGRLPVFSAWRRRRDSNRPSCGAQNRPRSCVAAGFDRCASPCSLFPAPRALRRRCPRLRRSGSSCHFSAKSRKDRPFACLFCLAEKEGLEPSRRLPDLRP